MDAERVALTEAALARGPHPRCWAHQYAPPLGPASPSGGAWRPPEPGSQAAASRWSVRHEDPRRATLGPPVLALPERLSAAPTHYASELDGQAGEPGSGHAARSRGRGMDDDRLGRAVGNDEGHRRPG